jgi:hypothetical protein
VIVEVLHIDGCPSWAETVARLRRALDATGLENVPILHRLLMVPEDIAGMDFAGSPTILIDGEDLFPTSAPASELACRIYLTPAGPAGAPPIAQLIAALESRARRAPDQPGR